MGMGMKSGLGKGLAGLGQMALQGGMAKAQMNQRDKMFTKELASKQDMFDKDLAFRTRVLASQVGWKLGLNDVLGKPAGGSAVPTAPPADPTATQAVGPFRLPGFKRPGGPSLPSTRMSMSVPEEDDTMDMASLLDRG